MSTSSDKQGPPHPSDPPLGLGAQAVPTKPDASTAGLSHESLPELPVFHDLPELPDFSSMTLEEQLDTSRLAHLSDEDLGMHLPGASRLNDDFFGPPSHEDGDEDSSK